MTIAQRRTADSARPRAWSVYVPVDWLQVLTHVLAGVEPLYAQRHGQLRLLVGDGGGEEGQSEEACVRCLGREEAEGAHVHDPAVRCYCATMLPCLLALQLLSYCSAVLPHCCAIATMVNQSIPPLLPSCAARRLSPTRCNSSGRMSVPAYAAAARRVDHMHLHAQPMKRNDCVGYRCMHVSETNPVLEVIRAKCFDLGKRRAGRGVCIARHTFGRVNNKQAHMHMHAWPICRSRTVDMNLGARIHTRPEISVALRVILVHAYMPVEAAAGWRYTCSFKFSSIS